MKNRKSVVSGDCHASRTITFSRAEFDGGSTSCKPAIICFAMPIVILSLDGLRGFSIAVVTNWTAALKVGVQVRQPQWLTGREPGNTRIDPLAEVVR